jgi:hypothetical protein
LWIPFFSAFANFFLVAILFFLFICFNLNFWLGRAWPQGQSKLFHSGHSGKNQLPLGQKELPPGHVRQAKTDVRHSRPFSDGPKATFSRPRQSKRQSTPTLGPSVAVKSALKLERQFLVNKALLYVVATYN